MLSAVVEVVLLNFASDLPIVLMYVRFPGEGLILPLMHFPLVMPAVAESILENLSALRLGSNLTIFLTTVIYLIEDLGFSLSVRQHEAPLLVLFAMISASPISLSQLISPSVHLQVKIVK